MVVAMASALHHRGMADAQAEDEPVRPRFGQRSGTGRHRLWITRPDVGDAAGDDQSVRRGKQDCAMSEGFPTGCLAIPDGPYSELLDLGHHLALDLGRLSGQGTEE